MKKIIPVLLALAMVFSLAACGASPKHQSASYSETPMEAPSMAANAYYADNAVAEEAAMDYSAAGGVGGLGSYEKGKQDNGGESQEAAQINPDKIIYSADATVETTEFEKTLEALEGLIEKYGGFIESSSINGSNYYNAARGQASTRSAYYTLRIPGKHFNTLMTELSTLGNVPYTHTYTENVTSQYYDTEARLNAYKTQETRLLEMMELAETVEDVIALESRLAELRYQIESLQSSLNNWDRRVSYSTVSVDVQEVREYTPQVEVKRSYGQELADAMRDALKGAGNFFKDLLVFLVSALPTLVILAVLFFALRKPLKKLREKREDRKLERELRKEDKKQELEKKRQERKAALAEKKKENEE